MSTCLRRIRVSRTCTRAACPLYLRPAGCKLNRLNLVAGDYAAACLQAARDCGTEALDLWTLMQKDGQVRGLLGDPLCVAPSGQDSCPLPQLNQRAGVGGGSTEAPGHPSPTPLAPAGGPAPDTEQSKGLLGKDSRSKSC